jgi:hypothetical protein
MQGSEQIQINASTERVYALVADLTRMGEWSPECQRVEWDDAATGPALGATFTGHNRGGPLQLLRWSRRGRVIAADPGREFAFTTEEAGRDSTVWRYRFQACQGGTIAVESYDVKWIPRWIRAADVLTRRKGQLQRAMASTLEQLKATAETP